MRRRALGAWALGGLLALAGCWLLWERQQTQALRAGWTLPQLQHHDERQLEACEQEREALSDALLAVGR